MPKARLELFDFQEVSDMLKWRNVRSGLKIHIAKANSEIGTIARKALREFMRKGAATRKNKALTIILKGGNKPLFHTGQMANSLQKKRESWHTMRVGFVDDKQVIDPHTNRPRSIIKIATGLHEGYTITVTPQMRAWFHHMANKNRKVKPLKPSTTKIVVRPRPFLLAVLEQSLLKQYHTLYSDAVAKALLHKTKHRGA